MDEQLHWIDRMASDSAADMESYEAFSDGRRYGILGSTVTTTHGVAGSAPASRSAI